MREHMCTQAERRDGLRANHVETTLSKHFEQSLWTPTVTDVIPSCLP